MLNRTLAALAVLAFVCLPLAAQADSTRRSGADMELIGQVIDISCHTTGVSGPGHTQCAQVCARAGVALAILGTDGNIYIPVSSKAGDAQNSRLLPFVETRVKVNGIHRFANGLHTIEITSVVAAT